MREEKIKLVYVLPDYDPNIGSHFYHVYELLERVKDRLDIYLIIEKANEKPNLEGYSGVYVQRFQFLPFRAFELYIKFLQLRLKGWKTLWIHYSVVAGLMSLDFKMITGMRVFYWNCGLPWKYKRNFIYEGAFRLVLKITTLVTGTEGMKQKYMQEYKLKEKKIVVFPNWINIERFQKWQGKKIEARKELDIEQSKKVVLYAHHLSERKGAHRIVPVAEIMRDTEFLVVGDGPYKKVLSQKSKVQNLSNVRILDSVPNKEIPKYFAASDVFFMPSDEEGFPRVLLESMAMNVPFVASDVGGVREIIPESMQNFVVEHDDIEAYKQKLHELLANPISTGFQEHLRQYDIEEVSKRFLEIVN